MSYKTYLMVPGEIPMAGVETVWREAAHGYVYGRKVASPKFVLRGA